MKLSDHSEIGISLETIAEPNHTLLPCPDGLIWYQDHRVFRGRTGLEPIFTDHWQQVRLPRNIDEVKFVVGVTRKIDGNHFWAGFPLSELTRGNFVYPENDWENLQRWLSSARVTDFLTEAVEACELQHNTNTKSPTPSLPHELLAPFPRVFWPYLSRLRNGAIAITRRTAESYPKAAATFADWQRQKQDSLARHN